MMMQKEIKREIPRTSHSSIRTNFRFLSSLESTTTDENLLSLMNMREHSLVLQDDLSHKEIIDVQEFKTDLNKKRFNTVNDFIADLND